MSDDCSNTACAENCIVCIVKVPYAVAHAAKSILRIQGYKAEYSERGYISVLLEGTQTAEDVYNCLILHHIKSNCRIVENKHKEKN